MPQYNHFFISLPACLLQRKIVDYTRVQEYSLRVLKWRPGNAKALYRAGVATLEMGDAETAKEYLIQASKEQPNGKDPDSHDRSEQVDIYSQVFLPAYYIFKDHQRGYNLLPKRL